MALATKETTTPRRIKRNEIRPGSTSIRGVTRYDEENQKRIFFGLIERDAEGHWNWKGMSSRGGDSPGGSFNLSGEKISASKAAFILTGHEDLIEMYPTSRLRRFCSSHRCVNPAHHTFRNDKGEIIWPPKVSRTTGGDLITGESLHQAKKAKQYKLTITQEMRTGEYVEELPRVVIKSSKLKKLFRGK